MVMQYLKMAFNLKVPYSLRTAALVCHVMSQVSRLGNAQRLLYVF